MLLQDLDPATLQASPEVNALICESMGGQYRPASIPALDGEANFGSGFRPWSPSTNPAHALEVMLEADWWELQFDGQVIVCKLRLYSINPMTYRGDVSLISTDNNKGRAVALAIMRAIVAAMQAKAAGGE